MFRHPEGSTPPSPPPDATQAPVQIPIRQIHMDLALIPSNFRRRPFSRAGTRPDASRAGLFHFPEIKRSYRVISVEQALPGKGSVAGRTLELSPVLREWTSRLRDESFINTFRARRLGVAPRRTSCGPRPRVVREREDRESGPGERDADTWLRAALKLIRQSQRVLQCINVTIVKPAEETVAQFKSTVLPCLMQTPLYVCTVL
ncbi:hypothetical protein SKAU_G00390340 [Synaphobranchus kaupii]|uniref:Uncharacterized protein n=1 Tax=Synaphobranchus kaupii TaxID=118154 RepID=A0A9Q1EBF9_SYNKA|nr:hypothetical protein SKAU_G00390340 [Synaphobranchus kaupii]